MKSLNGAFFEKKAEEFVTAVKDHSDDLMSSLDTGLDKRLAGATLEKYQSKSKVLDSLMGRMYANEYVFGPENTLVVLSDDSPVSHVEQLLIPFLTSRSLSVKFNPGDKIVRSFVDRLPRAQVAKDRYTKFDLPAYLLDAEAVVAHGSHDVVEEYRKSSQNKRFIGHESKFSIGIYDRFALDSLIGATADITGYSGTSSLNTSVLFYRDTIEGRLWIESLSRILDAHDDYSTQDFMWKCSSREGLRRIGNHVVQITPNHGLDLMPVGGGTVLVAPYVKNPFTEYEEWYSNWWGKISSAVVEAGGHKGSNSLTKDQIAEGVIGRWGATRVTTPGESLNPPVQWSQDGKFEALEMCSIVAKEG